MERIQKEFNVKIEYVNFPLHPETPDEGISLEQLFAGRGGRAGIEESQRRMKALCDAEGLPINPRDRTYNSRLAQELGVWATEQGKGEAYHLAAFRAYFVDAKNLALTPVLLDIAGEAGLDRKEAQKVITTRSYRAKVDAEWETSTQAGVNAVPTFEAGGQRVVGAQPYEVLVQLVRAAGAQPRVNAR